MLYEENPSGPHAPAFSIIVPVHNRQHLLGRALWSIQAQTFQNFEVIVVDDGSIDDPATVVTELDDNRFCIVRQVNAGAAAARNNGAGRARGEYLAFLDSDDEALPGWLATVMEGFARHQAGVVCLGVKRVDDVGGAVRYSGPKSLGPLYRGLEGKFLAGSYALRRKLFLELGGFDASLPAGHHTDFSLRLCERLGFGQEHVACIDTAGILIHDHEGEKIRRDPEALMRAHKALLRKHSTRFDQCPEVEGLYLANAAVSAYRTGARGESIQLLWEACRTYPRGGKNWIRLGLAISGAGSLVWPDRRD